MGDPLYDAGEDGRANPYAAPQAEVSDLKSYTTALEEFLDENGTGQQLIMSVQEDIDVNVVVLNNNAWLSIRNLQVTQSGWDRVLATEFDPEDDPPFRVPVRLQVHP